MEAHHGSAPIQAYDKAKQMVRAETERLPLPAPGHPYCRNGGTVSVIGVYGGMMDKFPIGSLMNRSLTVRSGQCHVQRYTRPLMERIENGEIDPKLRGHPPPEPRDAPQGYETFKQKEDECMKVVLTP